MTVSLRWLRFASSNGPHPSIPESSVQRAVPALYLAILAVFVAAGSLLTARIEPTDTVTAVPEDCSVVPEQLVQELFPGADVTSQPTADDDARYGRWIDGEGRVLVELRCTRFGFSEFGPYRDAVAAAEAGGATMVGTEPPAILAEIPDGSIIRQLEEDTGIFRTWFVRTSLSPAEAEDVVARTRRAQAGDGGNGPA